jgi:hypothetical protein
LDTTALSRTGLLYLHLLLCVFALHLVLSTDWRLLRARIGARALRRAHVQTAWLLGALGLSGLAIVALDTGLNPALMAAKPKLVAKLVAVGVLTFNGGVLRWWCFPRLVNDRPLGRSEAALLMCSGAISTASWLIAAFYGIARGLSSWSVEQHLALYGAASVVALLVALPLAPRLREGRIERARRRRGLRPAPATVEEPVAVVRQAA